MKRQQVIKLFTSYLEKDDLVIFAGNNICKEGYLYDRPGNFYFEDETGMGLSLALGIVMCTDKRVFIFCDDYYFLKDLSSSVHIALSGCRNIFLVVLTSGEYQYSGHNPTIFKEINSVKSVMFGAGFLINDYTKYFKDVYSSKVVKGYLNNLYGPLFVVIYIDLGENKKVGEIKLTIEERLKRLTKFLSMEGTSMYMAREIEFTFEGEEKK